MADGWGSRSTRRRSSVFFKFLLAASVEDCDQHVCDLLANEWERPGEDVHEVREPVRVRCAVELSDVHDIVLVFEHGSLVVVHVQVVRGGEDRHHRREASRPSLSVHTVSCILCLVRSNDREQVVLLQERASSRIAEEVRASSHMVVHEILLRLLLSEFFKRVGPENVAHQAMSRWLSEAVQRLQIFQRM